MRTGSTKIGKQQKKIPHKTRKTIAPRKKTKRRQAKAMIACGGARARAREIERKKRRARTRERRETQRQSAKGQCATAHKWIIARTRSNPSQTINASYLPRLPKLTTPTKDDVPLAESSPHPLFLPPMVTSLEESSNTLLPVIFYLFLWRIFAIFLFLFLKSPQQG
jgi:hypothetical protein